MTASLTAESDKAFAVAPPVRMEDGDQVQLPLFGGARGPDVTRNMREMERVFCAALNDLGASRQIISDNRSTQWLNDFRK